MLIPRLKQSFLNIDVDTCTGPVESGIGVVLISLLRHPNETRENKEKIRAIYHSWSQSACKNEIVRAYEDFCVSIF